MTMLRQWQLLDAVMPLLVVLRPLERMVAWNLGHVDDALAVTLAYLHHANARAARLVTFHSGPIPLPGPVEWTRADVRGVPTAPWLQPVEGRSGRWRPDRQLLESVVLARPSGPVDLLVGDESLWRSGEGLSPLANVRRGGHLLLPQPPPPTALRPGDWTAVDGAGHLYRKVSGRSSSPVSSSETDDPGSAPSLASHHDRATLISSYSRLAYSVARRFAHRGERVEDLEQVAMMALVKAAGQFDPNRGRPFAAYATICISGELKRHFRDKMWTVRVPRSVQEMHLEVRAARDVLLQSNGASPTIAEIAEYLKVTEETVLATMEAASSSWATSLNAPSADGDGEMTDIPVTDAGFDEILDHRVLKESISQISPTERLILKRVFFEGQSQRQIAKELNVSQMHISRLMARTLGKMRQQFQFA